MGPASYNRRFVTYQLIIRLFWCEVSNNVDSFLLLRSRGAICQRCKTVASSVVEAVRTEVKRTIDVKHTYEKIIYYMDHS